MKYNKENYKNETDEFKRGMLTAEELIREDIRDQLAPIGFLVRQLKKLRSTKKKLTRENIIQLIDNGTILDKVDKTISILSNIGKP